MRPTTLRISGIITAAAVAGLLLGSSGEGESDQFEWEMFGQQIAVADGQLQAPAGETVFEGTSFLYNKRTGEVYRVFLGCGDLGINGCLEVLPVVGTAMLQSSVPPSRVGGNQIRR